MVGIGINVAVDVAALGPELSERAGTLGRPRVGASSRRWPSCSGRWSGGSRRPRTRRWRPCGRATRCWVRPCRWSGGSGVGRRDRRRRRVAGALDGRRAAWCSRRARCTWASAAVSGDPAPLRPARRARSGPRRGPRREPRSEARSSERRQRRCSSPRPWLRRRAAARAAPRARLGDRPGSDVGVLAWFARARAAASACRRRTSRLGARGRLRLLRGGRRRGCARARRRLRLLLDARRSRGVASRRLRRARASLAPGFGSVASAAFARRRADASASASPRPSPVAGVSAARLGARAGAAWASPRPRRLSGVSAAGFARGGRRFGFSLGRRRRRLVAAGLAARRGRASASCLGRVARASLRARRRRPDPRA